MFKRIGLVCLASFVVLATTVYAVSSERQKKLEQERLKAGITKQSREMKLQQERLKAGKGQARLVAASQTTSAIIPQERLARVAKDQTKAYKPVPKGKPAKPYKSRSGAKQLLSEGFEGSWLPSGWTQIINNYNTNYGFLCTWDQVHTDDFTANSGNYSAGLWWDFSDQDEWLITPPIYLGGPKDSYLLSFWTYGYRASPYGDHYYVKVSDNGGASWDTLLDLTDDYSIPDTGWNEWAEPIEIDLSSYAGSEIQIAWHAWAIGGLWWAWFIDDVEVTAISGHDVGVTSIDVPSGALGPGIQLTPEITVKNFGGSGEIFDIFMEIYVGGGKQVYTGSAYGNYLDAQASGSFELSPDWTPSSEPDVYYDVYAWTDLDEDENPDNDTLQGEAHTFGVSCGDTLHFDDPATAGFNAIGLGDGEPYYTWEAAIRLTPDELAPYAGGDVLSVLFLKNEWGTHSGQVIFYDEGTMGVNCEEPGDLITSVPIELADSGWHQISVPAKGVFIDGSKDLWISIELTHANGEFPFSVDAGPAVVGKGDFVYSVDLDPPVWYELYQWELDYNFDIRAIVCPPGGEYIDAAVTDVAEPADQSIYLVGAVITPEATVKNNGTDPQTFDVTCEMDMYTKAYQDVQTVNNLAPGTEETVYFTSWEATLPGPYYACVYTSLEGDENPGNDEICNDFGVATYLEDFEDDEGGYTPECAWEWGVPDFVDGPESAYSGDNCWGTVLDYDYPLDANCKLYSRLFKATSDFPGFGFFHWYDTEGSYSCYDGGNLKITVNGGDPVIVETVLPYYNGVAPTGNEGIPGEPCWFGHDQQYWEGVAVDLSPYVTTDDQFQLIWHFGSDYSLSYAGWYIDDAAGYGFETITFIDVGVVEILAPVGFYTIGSMVTPTAIIKNYGDTEETFDVCCWIGLDKKNKDNGDYEECLEVTLEPGEEDTLEFPEWEATEEGFYYCNVWTDLEDMNPDNDSIYSEFTVVSYVQDFETSGGGFASPACWAWGEPVDPDGPDAAFSGVNVWGTVLDGDYPGYADCQLTSLPFDVTGDYPLFLFAHWYDTEFRYDGGNVKISVNGEPWDTVMNVDPPYDVIASSGNEGIPYEWCYSGHDQGYWDIVFIDLSSYVTVGDQFQIMWHFGSDNIINYPGWFIDDVAGIGFELAAVDHDVAVIQIGFSEVIDTLIKLHAYTMAGIVRNNSPETEESFRAHLKIEKNGKLDYSAFVTVTDLPPSAVDTVYFSPDWVPRQIGYYKETLNLRFDPADPLHDPLPGNNVKSESLWVVDIGGPPSLPIIPKVFFLNQNAPNPMTDRTIIEFGLPKETAVKLSIYSSTGRLIKVIENETKVPGYYRIDWDGKDATGREVGSGVYFYKLEAGNYKSTKKLTIIR